MPHKIQRFFYDLGHRMLVSALGQKQTFAPQKAMSALPPKAEMCSALAHVCFGPKADISPGLPSDIKRLAAEVCLFRASVRPLNGVN
jgi:hypothetical protein